MNHNSQEFPYSEFLRFRWAHANANSFLYGALLVFCFIVGIYRWLTGIMLPWMWFLTGLFVVWLFIPSLGFFLARHIVGFYYKKDYFGHSYKEYRLREKQYGNKPDEDSSEDDM